MEFPDIEAKITKMATKLVEGLEDDERETMLCDICRMCQPGDRDSDRP
jgi:hypothetical protein